MSVKIVFVKQKSTDLEGILNIRIINGNDVKKQSIKIKLPEKDFKKYFDKNLQRFKKNYSKAEGYNDAIEVALSDVIQVGNEARLPNNKKSFIKYWQHIIDTTTNHGSKIIHQTHLKKIKGFLTSIDKTDLLFSDINQRLAAQMYFYLKGANLSNNTANHCIKVFKSIIEKAKVANEYIYTVDPFATIKLSNEAVVRKTIDNNDLRLLLETKIKRTPIDHARVMFLFQLFSNGMRVSDLWLLRWNNIQFRENKAFITYKMFKTKQYPPAIPIGLINGRILGTIIDPSLNYDKIISSEKISFSFNGEYKEANLKQLDTLITNWILTPYRIEGYMNTHQAKFLKKSDFDLKKNSNEIIHYHGYDIKKDDGDVKILIDIKQHLIEQANDVFLKKVYDLIKKRKADGDVDFVFPVLSNEEFKNIDGKNNFSQITEEQFKRLKGKTIGYNINLKVVGKLCGISQSLSSHVPRHSFTNMVLNMEGVNLNDVSKMLAHSTIAVTNTYIKTGFNFDKITDITTNFDKSFGR